MALSKNIEVSRKVAVENNGITGTTDVNISAVTYIRVEAVHLANNKSEDSLKRAVIEASFTGEGIKGERKISFPYDMSGDNPIKQAYLHLKTLPEFADATDV
jgi:hypothetical protein